MACRVSRLTAVEGLSTSDVLTPQHKVMSKCKRMEAVSTSTSRRCKEDTLDKRIDALTLEFAQIKSLILNLQTGEATAPVMENPTRESPISEEDAMSMTASHGQFCEIHSQFSHDDSQNTAHGSVEGLESDQDVVRQALHVAPTPWTLPLQRQPPPVLFSEEL